MPTGFCYLVSPDYDNVTKRLPETVSLIVATVKRWHSGMKGVAVGCGVLFQWRRGLTALIVSGA
jgi:hypothetical protein